jgi:hypothetical protein
MSLFGKRKSGVFDLPFPEALVVSRSAAAAAKTFDFEFIGALLSV